MYMYVANLEVITWTDDVPEHFVIQLPVESTLLTEARKKANDAIITLTKNCVEIKLVDIKLTDAGVEFFKLNSKVCLSCGQTDTDYGDRDDDNQFRFCHTCGFEWSETVDTEITGINLL